MRWAPLLLISCGVELDDTAQSGLTEVAWVLDWDDSGVERTEGGWCTVTDRDVEVCVSEGELVTAMTSMVACSDATVRASWTDWFVATAVAGHPGDADPSAWTEGRVEDLGEPTAAEVARIELFGDAYCQAHWAVDAAWEGTADLQDDGLIGTSLWIRGTWRSGGKTVPFRIESELAWGELQDAELPSGAVEVHVVRELASMLDGVDFRSEADLDRAVLRNLAENTRFEVR